ncbi:hypothetical protein SNEBB_001963 [Seison nebaliae]|nr:hypothetical protein SNEBB_001963 [Seison nebaliae]
MDETESLQPQVQSKVFIQRDYRNGTSVRFMTNFPPELNGKIDKTVYDETIKNINSFYDKAEALTFTTVMESTLACLTAYLILLCCNLQYDRYVKQCTRYLRERNEKILIPKGICIHDPLERGLRCIEVAILYNQTSSRETQK